MKIFNWVQRKFHKNVDGHLISHKKDGLAYNAGKAETDMKETDTDAFLDHVTLVNVLDGWKDGILTIGTFGFDPFDTSNQQNEYSINNGGEILDGEEGEEYSVTEEEGELNPLVVKAFKHEFDKVMGTNPEVYVSKPEIMTNFEDTPLLRFLESPELKTELENEKKRTTLAELFSADSELTVKSDPGKMLSDSGKKPVCHTKHGLSFAKKFMPRKGEDSRPIRKLHQLVTRMMKKKIHPEIESKNHEKEGLIGSSKTLMDTSTVNDGAIEVGSLL